MGLYLSRGQILSELLRYGPTRENSFRNEIDCHFRRASAADHVLLILNLALCTSRRSSLPDERHEVDPSTLDSLLDHPNEYVRAQCLQLISISFRPFDELAILLPVSSFLLPFLRSRFQMFFRVFFSPLASYCHFSSQCVFTEITDLAASQVKRLHRKISLPCFSPSFFAQSAVHGE